LRTVDSGLGVHRGEQAIELLGEHGRKRVRDLEDLLAYSRPRRPACRDWPASAGEAASFASMARSMAVSSNPTTKMNPRKSKKSFIDEHDDSAHAGGGKVAEGSAQFVEGSDVE
jgi:hypothetical protein